MRQFLTTAATLTLIASFAHADNPTPDTQLQLKQYNQALGCAGLAGIIWQLKKDKAEAAAMRAEAVRLATYGIELSKKIWTNDQISRIMSELFSKKPEDSPPLPTVLFGQDNNFVQGFMFAETTQKVVALVASKIPVDPTHTRSTDETNSLMGEAAQQEFDTLNCKLIGK
jgi:hypothetical protein